MLIDYWDSDPQENSRKILPFRYLMKNKLPKNRGRGWLILLSSNEWCERVEKEVIYHEQEDGGSGTINNFIIRLFLQVNRGERRWLRRVIQKLV